MGGIATKIVGWRKAGTAEGTWTGAYVAKLFLGMPITAALFEDGKDFVGSPTRSNHLSIVSKLVEDGWCPMTREDIFKTAGMV